MDHSFDDFSKSLSDESVPRRESLRRLGTVLAGAMLGPLNAATAQADLFSRFQRKTPYRARAVDPCQAFCKCRNAKQQAKCLDVCRACSGNTSRIGGSCGSYVCCATASCGGVCSDLSSSSNCGACGRACRGATPYCVNGTCGACPAGQTKCGKVCINLTSDNRNCGACGRVCGAGTTCVSGMCASTTPACPTGQTRCGTTCVNLSSNTANCGACGNACGAGETCVNGTCIGGGGVDCGYGAAFCGGICINILSDSANCGACGVQCAADEICTFGACIGTCSGC